MNLYQSIVENYSFVQCLELLEAFPDLEKAPAEWALTLRDLFSIVMGLVEEKQAEFLESSSTDRDSARPNLNDVVLLLHKFRQIPLKTSSSIDKQFQENCLGMIKLVYSQALSN